MKFQESQNQRMTSVERLLQDASDDNEEETQNKPDHEWIRGVNLGGWLLMERYITPYQFALTTCHVQGDFCWYPGQINAPPNAELCDPYRCTPLVAENAFGQVDYPMDEWSLWSAFGSNNTHIAEQWLNYHLEYFVTEQDIVDVKASGATHIRVPLAHWILQDQGDLTASGEAWIVGKRWEAFTRVVQWSRTHGLYVWPDIHTAPASQNGFDNSGRQYSEITCHRWSDNPYYVLMSLQIIRDVTERIALEGMQDVVTGFGLINEPFKDCDRQVYLDFMEEGLDIVRKNLGPNAYVYVSDLFSPEKFNTGHWWVDPARYNHTFLDTHYYHVFAETTRAISPRQHIALTCQNEYHVERNPKKTQGGIATCCWHDAPNNTVPSHAVKRMVGEWSAAVDTLPMDMLYAVMMNVADTGVALHLNRELTVARKDFLRNFVQAQTVIYEAADTGVGGAWFYWTLKMEGGAFAEWDYLRGIKEGWIPKIPHPSVSSESLYGTCYEIMGRTSDDPSVVHEYPDPQDDSDNWQGMPLDDDVVLSHGETVLHPENFEVSDDDSVTAVSGSSTDWWASAVVLLFLIGLMWAWRQLRGRRSGYTSLPQSSMPS